MVTPAPTSTVERAQLETVTAAPASTVELAAPALTVELAAPAPLDDLEPEMMTTTVFYGAKRKTSVKVDQCRQPSKRQRKTPNRFK